MILDNVTEAIVKTVHCNTEDVKPESELSALGVDSLKALTIIFELEETFDIEIPNEVIPSITNLSDIMDKLNDLQHQT